MKIVGFVYIYLAYFLKTIFVYFLKSQNVFLSIE